MVIRIGPRELHELWEHDHDNLRSGSRRLAWRLVLQTGGAAAAPGRARGLHTDPDRARRAHPPDEPRDRSRHPCRGH